MELNIIETFDLSKVYHLKKSKKKLRALNNINICIKEGEKFGLLGPNGAGKTTMVSILTTLIQPTSGYAIIDGFNILKKPNAIKQNIALMLGNEMIYYRTTGYANLKFFCKIYQIKNWKNKIEKLAQELGLEKWIHEYVEKYSTGMKMKLALCRVLIIDPKIMFLDEPTLGLDVRFINFIVEKLKSLDKTIFLTSHNLNLIEKVCDKFAFIKDGSIVLMESKEELKSLFQRKAQIVIVVDKNNQLIKSLEKEEFINDIEVIINENNQEITVSLKDRKNYRDLFSILKDHDVIKIYEKDLSIEDIFLKTID
ncbi:MAG TPA: ABC transporter ATP-binding protein [archaeon]|nr:ABC transporter ATP-binding protein [archaeon]